MKGWNYSVLSHNANLHGGPEEYIQSVKNQAAREAVKATDRKWAKSTVPALLILTPSCYQGVY